jgi:hypothetical protein
MGQTLNLVSQFGAPTFTSLRTIGNATIGGNLVVSGSITAQSLIVSTTSVYSGSTRFGEIISNTHQFTGSIFTSGSITVVGQYNGSGAGLTGTAASLSIGGNAATATTAGTITSQANSATITAASTNTANQIVLRDGSGNFSAGTITATLSGNATNISAYTINQNVGTSNSPTFDQVLSTNNGNGTNYRVGDDAWIGDVNAANTIRVKGIQDATAGYITFGNQVTQLGLINSTTLTWGAAFTATGNVTAFSDARVKTNIKTIDNALLKVLALRGVTYNRTDLEDKSEQIGIIAQEIKEILPQVVQENENGYYSVAYGNIVGVLIEAIKEQQTQIEELKLRL